MALRIGLIGCGFWGSRYAEKIRQADNLILAAAVDPDPARAAALADGARVCAHHEEILSEIEAAIIAVPARLHYQVAHDLLSEGIPTLVEKPLACSLDEADSLVSLARDKGTILQVASQERFNPAVIAASNFIERPRFVEVHRLGPFPGRATDVDVILDLMIHDLDLLLWLVSDRITHIAAHGVPVVTDSVDIANAGLTFANGCVANITASRVSLKRERKLRFFIPHTYISLDCMNQQLQVIRRRPPAPGERWSEIYSEPVRIIAGDALMQQLTAFRDSLRKGTRPAVAAEEGRRALAAAIQIQTESARWGDQQKPSQ